MGPPLFRRAAASVQPPRVPSRRESCGSRLGKHFLPPGRGGLGPRNRARPTRPEEEAPQPRHGGRPGGSDSRATRLRGGQGGHEAAPPRRVVRHGPDRGGCPARPARSSQPAEGGPPPAPRPPSPPPPTSS